MDLVLATIKFLLGFHLYRRRIQKGSEAFKFYPVPFFFQSCVRFQPVQSLITCVLCHWLRPC